MSMPFKLELFETNRPPPIDSNATASLDNLEETRLEAFEQGYKAGWDDATSSQDTDQTKVSSDFARNLSELSFTYHEARTTVLKSLEPLLKEMVFKVLPKIAHASTGQLVAEQIMEMAGVQSNVPIELVASTQDQPALKKLCLDQTDLPIKIIVEQSLGQGQIFIRLGEIENQVDISGVLEGLENAIDCFFAPEERSLAHG